MLNIIGKYRRNVQKYSMNVKVHVRAEQMTCGGLAGFFWTSLCQLFQPHTPQLADAFSTELHQRGRRVL